MPKDTRYLVEEGGKVRLKDFKTDDDGGMSKEDGKEEFAALSERLAELQELLYADAGHALLIVLQAMDTGGKDSTIRDVFGAFNPQGCSVVSFKAPTQEELQHDFLWRVHEHVPRRGYVGVFNRSHYEDVLIVRVKNLVPEKKWRGRYDHINSFEKMLTDDGVKVIKFFLHISKDYQKERLERRLEQPAKHWKFDPSDLAERARWDAYQEAYEDAISRCSTKSAPWYIIPAERHWYRNLVVARVLVNTLESMGMQYPSPQFDPRAIVIE
jgi:PPK2 family polyphosphate:nucleotide phosphotransferase